MNLFNFYGLIFVIIIMIPNVIFAVKYKDGFVNKWHNKYVEVAEQIGRFGCFLFMVINIPLTYYGYISNKYFILYIMVNSILTVLYCLIWLFYFKKSSIFRALSLSVIPSIMFLFSGIVSRYILLIVTAIIFIPTHILISYKNAK